jgi:CBS-domain-containing membrane protein
MKTTLVKEVYRLHGIASIRVPEDVSLEYVISYLGQEPRFSGVFLVDSAQHFSGAITSNDLIKWIDFQLFGGKGSQGILESEFFQIANAKKAQDLVRADFRALGVREEDTLQTALDKMVDYKEYILPVLDGEGHILGDLRLSEVLAKALEDGKRQKE